MKQSDYYFCQDLSSDREDNEAVFFVTSIKYFKKHNRLDDSSSEDVDSLMPQGFENWSESMYEYKNEDIKLGKELREAGKKALLDAGFVFSKKMQDM